MKDQELNPGEKRKRIGELLLEAGVVTAKQLKEALDEQKVQGGRLCYNLMRLGALRVDDLLHFLREQFGIAAVNIDRFHVDRKVVALISPEFARREKVLPLHLLDDTLTVAMMDPGREEIVEEIREKTGLKVEPLVSPEASLENALAKYYGSDGEGEVIESGLGVLKLGDEKKEKHLYASDPPREGFSPEEWLKRFFLQSIKRRSREIHLEPGAEGLRVRFRVGEKFSEGETAPTELKRGITNLALTTARIDSRGSAYSPMEGRLKIIVRNRPLRASLSSFPTIYGERLVLRIMDEGLQGRGFQELGMSKEVADEVGRILRMRTGVFLVNAPPRQGKKTTFYALLNFLNDGGERNIMTLEHPIQYPLPGVSQTQISFGQGVDFYFGLKSLLRQRPDVVGMTDIADGRTLELVFTAARQCLIVGLCSFWDNMQALEWISNCGVSASTQANLIRGLLVQRVLPRICSQCREKLDTPEELIEGIRDKRPEELVFYTGRGCNRCGQTGRAGRLGIFELLPVHSSLRDLIARRTELRIIYDEAQRQGMWTLQEDGIVKATQGLVDVRDVLDASREEGEEE